MGLKMKNVNIIGVHHFLGEGGYKKTITYGKLPKKWGLDNLQGSWLKKERRVFLRGGGGGGGEFIPRWTL